MALGTAEPRDVYIVGAKSVGQYGGYETFLYELTQKHQHRQEIRYHIAVKTSGAGCMASSLLAALPRAEDGAPLFQGARLIPLRVPTPGPVQAVVLDLLGLWRCVRECRKNGADQPVFYLLTCRIGPAAGFFARRIHRLGGSFYVNPDGHEWQRAKWPAPVRAYWKLSEGLTVRRADLLICDSREIERYIRERYSHFAPKTLYLSYGAELTRSPLADDDPAFCQWLKAQDTSPGEYYLCCARLVPENSFEPMIRGFMESNSRRKLVLITTREEGYLKKLRACTGFERDPRIRFSPPVYQRELLRKIRENAWANLHGHTVGGTNPTLLEALASTPLNLLVDVPFNREVAQDAAWYWTKEPGQLSRLIDRADGLSLPERAAMGERARARIRAAYTWEDVAEQYGALWTKRGTER